MAALNEWEAVRQIALKHLEGTGIFVPTTPEEVAQQKADICNQEEGTLTGYDCPECKNRGYFVRADGINVVYQDCKCMRVRRSLERIRKSGLAAQIEEYTFETYKTPEKWQKDAKALAQKYLEDDTGAWFVVTGSVGAGKSHLCTAICAELLRRGEGIRYMMWRDDGAKLKACVNDAEQYEKLIRSFKRAKVLYIDDFWKGAEVTKGDINLAFELLNYRYANRGLKTIISSEKDIETMMDIDEAVGSRIYHRSRGFWKDFQGNKNWRLRP